MTQYLAGVDVGTTGARCMIFDLDGNPVGGHYCDYGATYPRPGWVEQDSTLLIAKTMEACRHAIGSSAHRSAADRRRRLLRPTVRGLSRGCRWLAGPPDVLVAGCAHVGRSGRRCAQLISADEYYAQNGLPLGTTWIITKLLWMRKHEPALLARTARVRAEPGPGAAGFWRGRLLHRPVLCRVLRRVGCASRDLEPAAARAARLEPRAVWPAHAAGHASGDHQSADRRADRLRARHTAVPGRRRSELQCRGHGRHATRTGHRDAGHGRLGDPRHRATAAGFRRHDDHASRRRPNMWEVEGLSNAAAASLRWFRDVVGTREKEIEAGGRPGCVSAARSRWPATSPVGSRGLLFLPYLATAATPRWNAQARAAFVGLSFAHGRAEMARAVMEGVVLEIRDMFEQWRAAGTRCRLPAHWRRRNPLGTLESDPSGRLWPTCRNAAC